MLRIATTCHVGRSSRGFPQLMILAAAALLPFSAVALPLPSWPTPPAAMRPHRLPLPPTTRAVSASSRRYADPTSVASPLICSSHPAVRPRPHCLPRTRRTRPCRRQKTPATTPDSHVAATFCRFRLSHRAGDAGPGREGGDDLQREGGPASVGGGGAHWQRAKLRTRQIGRASRSQLRGS